MWGGMPETGAWQEFSFGLSVGSNLAHLGSEPGTADPGGRQQVGKDMDVSTI